MADAIHGMTPQGFVAKRLADILDDLSTGLDAITDKAGEHPFLNATDDSIMGQAVGIFAQSLSECWAEAKKAADQFDPLKNGGAGQSGTVQLNAIQRNFGRSTRIEMQLTGIAGALIPAGSMIANQDGSQIFAIDAATVIPASKTIMATATCTEKGDIKPETGSVFVIRTPRNGWLAARNTSVLSVGSFEETDAELRVRQQRSTAETSYRQVEAIYAAIMNLPDVAFARIYQNRTLVVDERGLPGKSLAAVVEGGDDLSIAEAIFKREPAGLLTIGNVSTSIVDLQGIANPVSFQRPIDIPVFAKVVVRITNRANFPDNARADIAQAMADYSQYGGAGNSDGFPPGAEIIRTRLFTPINSIGGHEIVSLTIGTSAGSLSENNIAVAWNKVGRFAVERIVVEIAS